MILKSKERDTRVYPGSAKSRPTSSPRSKRPIGISTKTSFFRVKEKPLQNLRLEQTGETQPLSQNQREYNIESEAEAKSPTQYEYQKNNTLA